MKMLHVVLLSTIGALSTAQVSHAAAPAKDAAPAKKTAPAGTQKVLGKPPTEISKFTKSEIGSGVYTCPSDLSKCDPIGVFAGYNPKLKKCIFKVDIGDINIPTSTIGGGGKITAQWLIVPMDGGTYRFTDDGINIADNTMATDWDMKDHGSGTDTYQWRSVHGRKWKSEYIVNVQRKHPVTGAWDNCDTVDPRINNT